MIVTCPACKSRYRVDDADLGALGRRVKCGECAHVWLQGPEEEDGGDDDFLSGDVLDNALDSVGADTGDDDEAWSMPGVPPEEDEHGDDIPESIRPGETPEPFVAAYRAEAAGASKTYGFAAAGVVFVLSFVLFVLLHGPLTRSWTGAQGAYGLFGIAMDVPGSGLVFDRMRVVEKDGALHVEGNILNLGAEQKVVPLIESALISKEGDVMSRWYIKPPWHELEGEGSMAFESVYDGAKESLPDASGVHLRFVLSAQGATKDDEGAVKTDAEDAGNTHAPHTDAPDHRNAHEES